MPRRSDESETVNEEIDRWVARELDDIETKRRLRAYLEARERSDAASKRVRLLRFLKRDE